MLKYDGTYFGVATAYDEQRGGTNAAANFFDGVAPFPIADSGDKDARLQANGYVNIAGVKLGGGWIGRRVESNGPGGDVRSNLFYLGAQYYVTPVFAVDGEAYRVIVQQQDARATLASLRATYFLSKRTAVYGNVAYLWNSAHARYSVSAGGGGTTPAAGVGQLGAIVGVRHSF
jgi:predicted porin